MRKQTHRNNGNDQQNDETKPNSARKCCTMESMWPSTTGGAAPQALTNMPT
jgi:hypothetical protein